MAGFRTAVKIIENHLTEYSNVEFTAVNSPWLLNHTYALVCDVNQTYVVGFTKQPWTLQEKFMKWRDTGITKGLPKKLAAVLTESSPRPRLFIKVDDYKATYKRIHRHLEEELTQFA